MNIRSQHTFKLVTRGDAGVTCDQLGIALGGVELARACSDEDGFVRCEVRSPVQVSQILQVAYGPQPEALVLRIHRGLLRAAVSIEAGDLALASIEMVTLGLPRIAPEAMAKLAAVTGLEKGGNSAWETEARIPAGQPGGGQWTSGGGAPSTAVPRRNAGSDNDGSGRPSSSRSDHLGADASDCSTASVAIGATLGGPSGPSVTADISARLSGDIAPPKGIVSLGKAGLLALAASWLDAWDEAAGRAQIANAMARFGLDPSRPADVIAAAAYVWSRYQAPFWSSSIQFRGPTLDAASEAVMRFVLVHPGAFVALRQDPTSPEAARSLSAIVDAANAGLIDYSAETRARPPGVAPELQTSSYAARRAIADQLKLNEMQVHHLVPAYNWGQRVDISALAVKAGWRVDDPSNLIALPKDAATQAEFLAKFGELLPTHNGSHDIYNQGTALRIILIRNTFPAALTPLQARAILDDVARINRELILSGRYDPAIKIAGVDGAMACLSLAQIAPGCRSELLLLRHLDR